MNLLTFSCGDLNPSYIVDVYHCVPGNLLAIWTPLTKLCTTPRVDLANAKANLTILPRRDKIGNTKRTHLSIGGHSVTNVILTSCTEFPSCLILRD